MEAIGRGGDSVERNAFTTTNNVGLEDGGTMFTMGWRASSALVVRHLVAGAVSLCWQIAGRTMARRAHAIVNSGLVDEVGAGREGSDVRIQRRKAGTGSLRVVAT